MYAPLLEWVDVLPSRADMAGDIGELRAGTFDRYRAMIDIVVDWEILAGLAERIHRDPRLRPLDRDMLLALVDRRETWIRPGWIRTPSG